MAWEDLKAFVGSNDDDDAYVASCFDTASTMVVDFIGSANVPTTIVDRAVLEVGSELYHRKNAPSGIAQFDQYGGAPVRMARDPMTGAYTILARYMVIGL